ncbi:hypothetical protein [Flavivirga jejuensis]|uniref:Lipoprotein n=1 Tax=Flavivirga jejuensis TaxID=870487 RepID=A0ABT8WVP7_9FLAO|nr:hypothetical protein [Flavivirga jejuensis]MDO5977228.1 hypothetical protein [Flavivirga jejuensis]
MNKPLTYILIFLAFSCVEKKKESDKIKVEKKEAISINTDSTKLKAELVVETKKSDSLFIDPSNFKYANLNKFDLRGWYYGKIIDSLKAFSSKEKLVEYFQDKRLKGENIYPVNYQYFSIQKNDKSEKIITIIEGDESCCHDLHYLIYNSENKLLSDNIVAGTGGDGMWGYDQYGKFVNDSTYILTRIDMEEIELENGGIETQIDSVITNYRFYKNKPFEKLTEQKFKKVEKQ